MIYSYNKTNEKHYFLKFIFGIRLYMFRTVSLSDHESSTVHTIGIGHTVYVDCLHVSDSFSVHHQESSTVHTAIGICHTGYADCLHVSDSFSDHHQESSTVHTAMGIGHTGYMFQTVPLSIIRSLAL